MKISKVICVVLSCAVVMSLTGCNLINGIQNRAKLLTSEVANMGNSNLKISKEVLRCFSENDTKGLKDLLCAKTLGLPDIDEQILVGFNSFKGKVISFNQDLLGYEGDDIENGKKVFLERSWNIENIETDADKTCEIYIYQYVICDNDKTREGISQITITNSDGTEFTIGYKWPIYYNDGRDMSYKVVKAFSDKDMDGLKSMFCAKTLKAADIDAQIQMGLSFFKGKATMGKTGTVDGHDTFDGNHDYRTYVTDHEIVKSHEPICTSISVMNENIETDTGKIYKIEFYAYLLNNGDEAYKGISQIIIINGDGTKQIIGERLD
jgi:hypothetical protein